MAKLISSDDKGFEFETVFGRRYRVPFGIELAPRNPMARKGGHVAGLRVDDDGVSNPLAMWGTKPRGCSALASLEKDYDLSSFAVVGKPLAADVVSRPVSESGAPPDDVHPVMIQRTEAFLGWPVAFAGDEPLIEDEELGRRLGYADPTDIRKLIERVWDPASRPRKAISPRRGNSPGRPRTPYVLTERQAVKVCLRSDTERASAIQDEVIDVFLAVRHGRPAAPAETPEAAAFRLLGWKAQEQDAQMKAIEGRFDSFVAAIPEQIERRVRAEFEAVGATLLRQPAPITGNLDQGDIARLLQRHVASLGSAKDGVAVKLVRECGNALGLVGDERFGGYEPVPEDVISRESWRINETAMPSLREAAMLYARARREAKERRERDFDRQAVTAAVTWCRAHRQGIGSPNARWVRPYVVQLELQERAS